MREVIYHGVGKLAFKDRETPEIGPHDVLVKNIPSGICGTDISAFTKGGDDLGIFPGAQNGHEFVSEVVEFGPAVDDPRIVLGLRAFVNASMSKRGDDGRTKLEITGSAGGLSELISIEHVQIG